LAAEPITGSAAFSFVLAMAMQAKPTAIERAFELAESGRYMSVGQIKYRLHVEGYFADAITGTQLCEQLKALMDTARKTQWHNGTGNDR
jgi:hypothetical protein